MSLLSVGIPSSVQQAESKDSSSIPRVRDAESLRVGRGGEGEYKQSYFTKSLQNIKPNSIALGPL